jgi:hypothetical protein
MLIHSASRFDGSAIVPKYNSELLAMTDNIREVGVIDSAGRRFPAQRLPVICAEGQFTE